MTQDQTGPTQDTSPDRNQFGTFGGVFTPSLLTILGLVMFMLAGKVVGHAGILGAVGILVIAKVITLLTGLSISAISTNTEVKGGGAYYLISRSLGPEFGGAIGLTLYLAQALSVPFYILGFVQAFIAAFVPFFPALQDHVLTTGLLTATLLFIVNYIGAGWVIKTQYAILAVLALSVVSFLGGSLLLFDTAQFTSNTTAFYVGNEYTNFWAVFAVFFPAVTGIMAGVNMSGDLKDPSRSIPKGTLLAIAVGGAIYLAQILIIGGSQDRLQLTQAPYKSLLDHALFGTWYLVVAGVFAATISSAIGSFMGAPRILQALARDKIFPVLQPFALGTLKGDEPQRGLWLTYFITLLVLWFAGNSTEGDALSAVAAILTMFFLFTYGMTNLAASLESFTANPSFRPRFRQFHWTTGLLGAAGCFGVTLLINPVAAVVAFVIIVALFVYINRRVLESTFGDARLGFYFARTTKNLFTLASMEPHPKNWRPRTLLFSGNPHTRLSMTKLSLSLASNRGLVTLAEILVGDFHTLKDRRIEAIARLQNFIRDAKLQAFSEVLVAPTFDQGMSAMLQAHSIGPLKPNMVIFGWPTNPERAPAMALHLRLASDLAMSQVICANPDRIPSQEDALQGTKRRRIDVWWRGNQNGSLMVILAYLLTLQWGWSRAKIRILRLVPSDTDKEDSDKELHSIRDAARIQADIHTVISDLPFQEVLYEHSRNASLVFLGFTPPQDDTSAGHFHAHTNTLLNDMPTILLTHSSGDADLMV